MKLLLHHIDWWKHDEKGYHTSESEDQQYCVYYWNMMNQRELIIINVQPKVPIWIQAEPVPDSLLLFLRQSWGSQVRPLAHSSLLWSNLWPGTETSLWACLSTELSSRSVSVRCERLCFVSVSCVLRVYGEGGGVCWDVLLWVWVYSRADSCRKKGILEVWINESG